MGTHPQPAGDPAALSVRLRAETSAIHRDAEQQPFMRTFFAGQLSREGYVMWLARQWHIYRTLEDCLTRGSSHPSVAGVVPQQLHRTARIAADLEFLSGNQWSSAQPQTPATRDYVDRINAAAEEFPPALLAHAWLRYLGNVGAREVLRRLTVAAIGEQEGDAGLAFTDYSSLGDVGDFFRTFHARLDAAPLTPSETDRVVAEGATGFRRNIALTAELAADLGLGSGTDGIDGSPADQ